MTPPLPSTTYGPHTSGNRSAKLTTLILACFAAMLMIQSAWEQRLKLKSTLSSSSSSSTSQSTTTTRRPAPYSHLQLQENDMGFCTVFHMDAQRAVSASSSGTDVVSLRSTSSSSTSSTSTRKKRLSSLSEMKSPLCKELQYVEAELSDTFPWSARVCRFFSRHLSKQLPPSFTSSGGGGGGGGGGGASSSSSSSSSSTSISTSQHPHPSVFVCNREISTDMFARRCGRLVMEHQASSNRSLNPYSREGASQTFFFWNKAMASSCDVSPLLIKDDGNSFPTNDYLPYVGTARSYYVVTTLYGNFANEVVPFIDHPFVLITGSSDYTAPIVSGESDGAHRIARSLLNNPLLIAWFAQNIALVHPKLVPIPIGIDFHSIALPDLPSHAWGKPSSALQQDALLQELRCSLPAFHKRPLMAIMNFKASGRDIRSHVFGVLEKRPGVKVVGGVSRSDLWRMYGEFSFVISPRGYGNDCHRTWEALTLGCAVIVSRDQFMGPLYDDLPVVQINDWDLVTEDNMKVWKDEISSKWHTYRWEKLRGQFWIGAVQRAVREGSVEKFWRVSEFKNNPDYFTSGVFLWG